MSSDKPGHKDAEIVLKLYDLRREAVMRDSRDRMNREFMPRTFEDVLAVVGDFTHPLNAAFRQTASYWEMVFGMAHKGIVNAEYLVENSGEGMLLYAKVQPFLERYRDEVSPRAFKHAEWAATKTEIGRTYLEFMQSRLAAMAAAAEQS
jgi:hypothetical protein